MNRSTLIGLGTLAAFVAAIIFGLNATHGSPLTHRGTVKAAFGDVSGLTVGDDVRMSGVRVGFVSELALQHGQAVAVLQIDDPDRKVYANAKAAVVDRSGFGQKFVYLDPGTSSSGPLQGTISRDHTVVAQDINQLFNVFDEKTRTAANGQLRELGGGMTGHAEDMHDLLRSAPGILDNTATVSGALSERNGSDLVGFMQSTDDISARFVGREQHVADVLDQLGTTFDAMAVDDGQPMEQTIQKSPETLDSLQSAFDDLRKPLDHTASAMKELHPGAVALGKATPDLRAFMRDSVGPLRKMPKFNKLGAPAIKSLTGLVHDARPLARQLITTGGSGAPPVSIISQYVPEIIRYFEYGSSMLNYDTSGGKYTNIVTIPNDESVGGKGKALTLQRHAYLAPGETDLGGQ